jgi:hypothetical protein
MAGMTHGTPSENLQRLLAKMGATDGKLTATAMCAAVFASPCLSRLTQASTATAYWPGRAKPWRPAH